MRATRTWLGDSSWAGEPEDTVPSAFLLSVKLGESTGPALPSAEFASSDCHCREIADPVSSCTSRPDPFVPPCPTGFLIGSTRDFSAAGRRRQSRTHIHAMQQPHTMRVAASATMITQPYVVSKPSSESGSPDESVGGGRE